VVETYKTEDIMFWVNFEWLVFTKPYNFEADGDTIKLNDVSHQLWLDMPPAWQGVATTIEVIQED